ncbi:MAG: hypothetical protein WKG07_29905 [Hymenobacter sp.]
MPQGKRTGFETLGYIRRPQDQRLTASIFSRTTCPTTPRCAAT